MDLKIANDSEIELHELLTGILNGTIKPTGKIYEDQEGNKRSW